MNRNTVIALAICFLILLLWGPLMQRLGWTPEPPEPPPPTAQEAPMPSPEDPRRDEPDIAPAEPPPAPDQPVDPDTAEPVQRSVADVPRAARPEGPTATVTLPNVLTAHIDRIGGGLTQVELHQYRAYDSERRVILGSRRFPSCTASVLGRLADGEVVVDTPTRFVLRRPSDDGAFVCTEAWEIDPERPYQIQYTVTFVNSTDQPLDLTDVAIEVGGMTQEQTAGARLGRVGAVDLNVDIAVDPRRRPVSYQVKDVVGFDADDRRELMALDPIWIAVHNKYFMFLLASEDGPFGGCRLTHAEVPVPEHAAADEVEDWLAATAFLPRRRLQPGEETSFSFTAYAGPKQYDRLQQLGRGAPYVMRLDLFMFWRAEWMGLISRTILRSLIWIRNAIGRDWGYGVAIIAITLVVKILFWPLTHKSTVSMRRMQQLQPLMQEIREKHRDDQQLMNQKIMELYREHKVNPVGGCLPIVFQIPVFFALFNTLRGAIELRQASFLWVVDLSMPDTLPWLPFGLPIRPLAIIMALTMLLQQRLSPASGNPSQTRMMTFMSLFFMFIFYSMPAGLTLYWTVNQLLTIGQNLLTRKLDNQGK